MPNNTPASNTCDLPQIFQKASTQEHSKKFANTFKAGTKNKRTKNINKN